MDLPAERLAALADRLRDHRYKVGTAQHIDACAVVAHLKSHGGVPEDPAKLAAYLAPIYCSSEEQQQAFESHLRAVLALSRARPDPPSPPEKHSNAGTAGRLLQFALLLTLAAAIVLGCYAWVPREVAVHVTAAGAPAEAAIRLSGDDIERIAIGGHTTLPLSPWHVWRKASIVVRRSGCLDKTQTIVSLDRIDIQLETEPPPKALISEQPTSVFERVYVTAPDPFPSRKWMKKEHVEWSLPRLAALCVPPLLAALWALYWSLRRRAWLMRLPRHTPGRIRQLVADARRSLSIALDAGRSAHELRRRRWQPSHELNLEATLHSAMERAGQPVPVFASRVEPEYLVLIDESAQTDHMARLADELMLSLQSRDVALKRYYFRDDPQRCDGPAREHQPRECDLPSVSLAQLQGTYPAHRLVLISDGQPLFDAGTGRRLPVVEDLLQWPDPVLMTPTRREDWGRREWALSRLGFVILPLDADGLTVLGELFGSDKPVQTPTAIAAGVLPPSWVRDPMAMLLSVPPAGVNPGELCTALRQHLGNDAFLWLQGCAVYPEIHWGMTLRIGAGLLPDDRRLARALTPLVRLPWLRESYMGEWLREALRDRMREQDWRRVHAVLKEILSTAEDDGAGDLPLRIASDPKRNTKGKSTHPADLQRRDLHRDPVFLRFLMGPPKRLALPAFEHLRKLFFKEGLWTLGVRAVPLVLIAASATVAIASTWKPRITKTTYDETVIAPKVSALSIAGDAADATSFVAYETGEILQLRDGAQKRWRHPKGVAVLSLATTAPQRVVAQVGAQSAIELSAPQESDAAPEAAWPFASGALLAVGHRDGDGGVGMQRATLSADGNDLLLHIGSAKRPISIGLGNAPVCMAFTDAGTVVAVGGNQARVVHTDSNEVDAITLPFEARCAVRAGSNAVMLWDTKANAEPLLWRLDAAGRLSPLFQLESGEPIAHLEVSTDGKALWVLRGSRVSAYDGVSGRLHGTLDTGASRIAATPDGSRLALIATSGAVEVWHRSQPRSDSQRVLLLYHKPSQQALDLARVLSGRYGYRTVGTPIDPSTFAAVDEAVLLFERGSGPLQSAEEFFASLRLLPPRHVLVIAEDSASLGPSGQSQQRGTRPATRLLLSPNAGYDAKLLPRLIERLEGAAAPFSAVELGVGGITRLSPLTGAGHTDGNFFFSPLNIDFNGFEVRNGRLWTDGGAMVRFVRDTGPLVLGRLKGATERPPTDIVMLTAQASWVSGTAHISIDENGGVTQHVALDKVWVLAPDDRENFKDDDLPPVIEVALQRGYGDRPRAYPARQLRSASLLVQALARSLPSLRRVIPYSDLDPGPGLPLASLQALLKVSAPSSRYLGMCDASAAVALDARHFIVADDERNQLTVYRRGEPAVVGSINLNLFLKASKEADIEGSARVGNRIYWISSHARNAAGALREDRHRFFATDVLRTTVEPVGKPYTALLADMLAAPTLAPLELADAAQRAPEADGGLNIEGLAAAPDGTLLIGLRNPVRQSQEEGRERDERRRALVIPLLNPAELIEGKGPARFGQAIQLDLGGRGVRSLERVGNFYLISAGPPADEGTFAVYRWSGNAGDAPIPLKQDLGSLRPEALFAWPDGSLTVLSDDGGVVVGKKACKDADKTERAFRAMDLVLP